MGPNALGCLGGHCSQTLAVLGGLSSAQVRNPRISDLCHLFLLLCLEAALQRLWAACRRLPVRRHARSSAVNTEPGGRATPCARPSAAMPSPEPCASKLSQAPGEARRDCLVPRPGSGSRSDWKLVERCDSKNPRNGVSCHEMAPMRLAPPAMASPLWTLGGSAPLGGPTSGNSDRSPEQWVC